MPYMLTPRWRDTNKSINVVNEGQWTRDLDRVVLPVDPEMNRPLVDFQQDLWVEYRFVLSIQLSVYRQSLHRCQSHCCSGVIQ